ncbi:hypothetical protein [Nonomuraea indica]|uniref:Uncharacterized protein n=1 Tax=Nonomuraea indica TaxID=1581193 RepID=A0ABW8A1I6_9ACTN|nr:hypothetical protein [Nonomuraea indica]
MTSVGVERPPGPYEAMTFPPGAPAWPSVARKRASRGLVSPARQTRWSGA